MQISQIQTPAYVCDEQKLIKNLEILKNISDESGAKILCALKGFAFSFAMPYVDKYLSGATCSGLHEAKYAKEFISGEIHTYSPAFKDEDFNEIVKISNHIVFNSFNQWQKFKKIALENGVECGLRINPQSSYAPKDMYNPCAKFSRLGITKENFKGDLLDGISGLHFHALCEESADSLELVLNDVRQKFGEFLHKMKWVNFGGGHHITKKGYDTNKLIKLIKEFKNEFGVEVYLEPGEAVGWECGYLLSSVLDIVENEKKIAILDVSAEAHMPDTILMPYRPKVRDEVEKSEFGYLLGGNTCLAGDIVGLEAGNSDFYFEKELKIGDKVIFEDQIHYTIVKNTTFNGIKLPDLVLVNDDGEVLKIKKLGYEEYKNRN